jgi:hypothetical protein
MRKSTRLFSKLGLVIVAFAALVVLGIPTSQAVVPVPAPNDRCGPDLPGADPCDGVGALTVPQATASGTSTRTCYEFITTATTAGPVGIDVVGGFVNDVWFRLAGPHCPGKRVIINTSGSTYTASSFLTTEGGGLPFYVCDTTCDAIAGNPFFDIDVVVSSGSGNFNLTISPALAGRDIYFLVNGGGSGLLRYCVTTLCP